MQATNQTNTRIPFTQTPSVATAVSKRQMNSPLLTRTATEHQHSHAFPSHPGRKATQKYSMQNVNHGPEKRSPDTTENRRAQRNLSLDTNLAVKSSTTHRERFEVVDGMEISNTVDPGSAYVWLFNIRQHI